jgi:type I restriction enzyme S subunit
MIFDLDKWFKFKVYLPPLPEQRKIAEILSTWDEAIDLTEQLIAAKQRRKQALMQRLLAGQVRFPGFEDEWVRRRVADFGNVVTGNTPPKDKPNYYEGEFPWTSPADMHSGKVTKTKTTLSPEGRKVARSVPKGSVLVTCIGSIGVNAIAEVDLAFNQQINAIVVNETYDNHFIYYLIDHHSQTLLSYAGTTSVPIINKSQFERIEYLVPSSVKEQNCIANILSACDDELALHQQKLAALRRQKQGLMQQLLTGRVRVVG